MFYVKQNESVASLRRVPVLMVDATDGATPETGLTLYPEISINGGAYSGAAGTWSEVGYGVYYYQLDSTETATQGFAGIHITASGARNYDAIAQIAAFNMYSSAGVGITAGDVWEYDISGISTAGTAGSQVNLAALPSGGSGISAQDVWDYVLISTGNSADSTLGDAKQYALQADTQTQATNLRPAVWDFDVTSGFATTTIPYPLGYIIQAGDATTTAASDVWNYDISAISTAGTAGSQLNLAAIASGGAGITAGDVWSFDVVGFGATNSAAVTLTQTLYTAGTIESYVSTQTPVDIWSYSGIEGRTITGGSVTSVVNPVSITTSSMSGVAGSVWNSPTSSFTTHGSFGYNVLRSDAGSSIGNVTLRSAGGINMVDADIHRIDNDVDAATNLKNALTGIGASWTGNIYGSVDSVVNPVDVTTTSMSGIANTVWSYATRTLTSGGGGATAGDIWSYATRTITGGIADTVTSVTNTVDISTQSVTDIWSEDVSAYSTPSAGYDLTQAASGGVGISAYDVWAFDYLAPGVVANSAAERLEETRTNTYNIDSAVGTVPANVWSYDISSSGPIPAAGGYLYEAALAVGLNSPQAIWEYDISGVTGAGLAGSQLNLAALPSGAGVTAGDVWSYGARTITGGSVTSVVNGVDLSTTALSGVATTVWNAATRTLTSLSNVTSDIWTAPTRTITDGYVSQTGTVTGNVVGQVGSVLAAVDVTTGSMASIANSTWNYATRTLTSAATGITAGDVWDYAGGRTITGGTITTNNDKSGYSLSGTQSFNLTGNITGNLSGSVGSVSSDVNISTASMSGVANTTWSYATRTLTSAATGITAGDVWDYASRTITGGSVTSVVNGVTVTTNNDKTGYALSTAGVNAVQSGLSTLTQAQVGTEVDSSLSDVGLTSTVTGRIDVAVSSRLASSSYTAPPTTAAIANTVWSYPTRTITSGAGATAGDIWTYDIASISASGSAGKQLNDAAVSGSVVTIVNGPYRLTSIAEGTDGKIDILADSVQTLQLNCLDGFGQPFNITGYTTAVNVYDVSGALAENYTPTVNYASSGILSFDIDTVITAVTGRYTLVVELTAGAEVIQLGPIEILVRPL